MKKITQTTKDCYRKRFWFMRNLHESLGDDFLVCSEDIAYAFLWELCERLQEELTFVSLINGDRLLQLYSLIEKFPYATDDELIGRAKELYNMEYKNKVK